MQYFVSKVFNDCTMKFFIPLFIAIFFSASFSFAEGMIQIKGTVAAINKKCDGAEINIYDGNELVEVTLADSKGRFELELAVGARYTIRFSEGALIAKNIVFDLRVESIGNSPEPFECHVYLYSKAYMSGMSSSILDFPMAILEYNERKERLEFNSEYTNVIQELYQNMLIFAETTDKNIWQEE